MKATMMPTTVCLVRHGETDWNAAELTQGSTDIPLNETGREQALATARALARETWHAVVSSPLSRALETAEIIASAIGIAEVEPDERLVERNYGQAEGISITERDHLFPDKQIPGAEPWESVQERMLVALTSIAERHPGNRVVVVGHGAAITALIAHLSNGAINRKTVRLKNASMNRLRYDGSWEITAYNQTADDSANVSQREAATGSRCGR